MAVASKLVPIGKERWDLIPSLHKAATCGDIFHPWATGCHTGAALIFLSSFWSSARFFGIMYLFQAFLKRSKDYKSLVRSYIRSILHGSFSGFAFVCANCIFRNTTNRYHRYLMGLGSGFFAGLPVFFEQPYRRNTLNIVQLNMVLDMLFQILNQRGYKILTESLKMRLVMFIIFNSVLLYKLQEDPKYQSLTLWYFVPSRTKKSNQNNSKNRCIHDGTCWENVLKAASLYFMIGIGVQTVRNLLYLQTLSLPNLKDMGFPVFAASYVSLYKAVACALYQYEQTELPYHGLLGGLVSGTAFWFYPSRSIFLAALGNLIKVLAKDFKEAAKLPDLPYNAVSYAIFTGLLYEARVMQPEVCPKSFIMTINLFTQNKAQWIYSSFEKFITQLA